MTATWFSGLLLNFGTISPFSLVSPGPLSATKKEICFVGRYQLRYAGKTFSVLSRPTDGSEFFGRCAAQALIQRRIIAVFLFALQHIPQLTAIQLPAQFQKLIHSNIDMNIVRLTLTGRLRLIISGKCQMDPADREAVIQAFHKTVPGIFANDLKLISVFTHGWHRPSMLASSS